MKPWNRIHKSSFFSQGTQLASFTVDVAHNTFLYCNCWLEIITWTVIKLEIGAIRYLNEGFYALPNNAPGMQSNVVCTPLSAAKGKKKPQRNGYTIVFYTALISFYIGHQNRDCIYQLIIF